MVVSMRLLKPYYWHIAYLIVVPAAVLAVLWAVGWRVPEPELLELPDYRCQPVNVPYAEHRALAVRYGIPVDENAPYRLVLMRHRAFGKAGWRAELTTIYPARTELGFLVSTVRDTYIHETQDAAMKEAAEWWAGCR